MVLFWQGSFAPDLQFSFNAANLQNNHFLRGANVVKSAQT